MTGSRPAISFRRCRQVEDGGTEIAEAMTDEAAEIMDYPLVLAGHRSGGQICDAARLELLTDGNGREIAPSVSILFGDVADGVGNRASEPQIHRTEAIMLEALEKRPEEQLRCHVVRPLLDFSLVPIARPTDRGGDITDPVEASHSFKDLSVSGVGRSGDDLLQLGVKELVVSLGAKV